MQNTYQKWSLLKMTKVRFEGATRIYDKNGKAAVNKLDLEVGDGEFLVLVGPSGCGKSTTLRMLAGLEPVNAGAIYIGGKDVTNIAPKDRDIAMVFQNYALYPHMTVAENMAFALQIQKIDKNEIKMRVNEAAQLLDLSDFLQRKPKALSGGQRQRVAMGRAIVRNPQVFLMDEPLSNLDAKLRVQTRTQIAALQRRLGVTTVYVTHDQVEAMTMGDRVAVLKDGILQQVASPRELYEKPSNAFVAGFIGSPSMSIMQAKVDKGYIKIGNYRCQLNQTIVNQVEESVLIGVRPEDFEVSEDGITIGIDLVEELGADSFIYGSVLGDLDIPLIVRVNSSNEYKRGQQIKVKPKKIYYFDTEGDNLALY
jgi:multiple sugar transport system ATP-binding protein